MHLIPPMDDEPPHDFVDFVTAHVAELRRETDRLVGGDPEGGQLYLDALADVAGRWRRLRLLGRLTRRDHIQPYLLKRLTTRAEDWRNEQVYEVDIRVLHPQHTGWSPAGRDDRASIALRKAALIPGTRRGGVVLAVADAGIAWVHAYRRQQWHRAGRLAVVAVLLMGGFIQYASWVSSTSS